MNQGTVKLENNFFNLNECNEITHILNTINWKAVWEDGSYADDKWREIKIITEYKDNDFIKYFPQIAKIKDFFKTEIISMMFYSMTPGAEIHPHRDMIGNVGWGGLRFHIPIQTNANVFFMVSNERIIMNIGELWALDTSFLHSVSNKGETERIHLVFDVKVNDWVKNNLIPPRTFKYYLHHSHLMLLYFKKFVTVLFNPKEFKNNMLEMTRIIKNLKK